MSDTLFLLVFFIFAFLPGISILYVIKGKKNWLFSLITVLITAALIAFDLHSAYSATDFHGAAFILQLFMPLQIFSAILTLIIGNIVLLAKKGFFTKKRIKSIFIVVVALVVLVCLSFFTKTFISIQNNKSLPDIAYTSTNTQFNDQGSCVIWDSNSNKYKIEALDNDLLAVLDKFEYAIEYNQYFDGTEYEGSFARRVLVDNSGKKIYMIAGGNDSDSYLKLFCYDKDSNSLNLIVDGDSWIYDFDLSDDGSYLVYEISDKLIKLDLASNESTVIKDNIKQKDKSAADEKLVRISKDGKYIMYYYGSDAPVPFQKYIYVYNVEKDMIQKVAIKLTQGFYNANWYEE